MQDAIEAAAVSLVDGPDLSQEALSALHSVYQQVAYNNIIVVLDWKFLLAVFTMV